MPSLFTRVNTKTNFDFAPILQRIIRSDGGTHLHFWGRRYSPSMYLLLDDVYSYKQLGCFGVERHSYYGLWCYAVYRYGCCSILYISLCHWCTSVTVSNPNKTNHHTIPLHLIHCSLRAIPYYYIIMPCCPMYLLKAVPFCYATYNAMH